MEINDILLPSGRELTEIEKKFRDKFLHLLGSGGYIPQEGEKIAQCLCHEGDEAFYNPYWFVSSKGYLMSAWCSKMKVLKPSLKTGGAKKKNPSMFRWTDYTKSCCKKWEEVIEKGYSPQYYFYSNSYPKSVGLVESRKRVPMAELIAFYHLPESERSKVFDQHYMLHHLRPFDWSRNPQYSNQADNFQMLLEKKNANKKRHPELRQHMAVHTWASDTKPEKIVRMVEQMSLAPQIVTTDLERWFLAGIAYTLANQGNVPSFAAMKNEDGSPYLNSYGTMEDISKID